MDSLKSKVIAQGRKVTASVGPSAAEASSLAKAAAAAAAEASSLAKAAAMAKLASIQQPHSNERGAGDGSTWTSSAEEKKSDDADAADAAIVLNAETTAELSNQLVEMMEENGQKEAAWKETIVRLEAKVEERVGENEALREEKASKEDELAESAAKIVDLEAQIVSLRQDLTETKAEKDAEHARAIDALQDAIRALEERVKAGEDKLIASEGAFAKERSELEAAIRQGATERRRMHNTIQELRGNIRVFARVRPFLPGDGAEQEQEQQQPSVLPKADGVSLQLKLKGDDDKKNKDYSFSFDHVFHSTTTQHDVFAEVSEFVQSALDGYNVCLFSYGQTGSGKTHTMQGSGLGDARGIIPRAIERVGEYKSELEAQGWEYEMKVSFLEIYNEQIRDLLRDEEIGEKKHEIKVNPDGSRLVTDLTVQPLEPADSDAVKEVMEKAAKYRTVASTNMNDVSSRSHSIFTLHLTAVHSESNQRLKGVLNLCDLAGSERLKRSGVSGDQAKEAMSINKSLSALTNVFVSLGSKAGHVPYRNSKLTWLLQPSLSGDGKTLMLCNLSPTEMSSQESLSSLRFASQVNQCELGAAKRSISDVAGDGSNEDEQSGTPTSRRSSQRSAGSSATTPPPRRSASSVSSSSSSGRKPPIKSPPPSATKM